MKVISPVKPNTFIITVKGCAKQFLATDVFIMWSLIMVAHLTRDKYTLR